MATVAAGCRKALISSRWAIVLAQMEGDSAWRLVAGSCRKALVNARWAIALLSCTNGSKIKNTPFALQGLHFKAAFSPEERSLVGGPGY